MRLAHSAANRLTLAIWAFARVRAVHSQIRVSMNSTVVRLDSMRAELDRMRQQLVSLRFSHTIQNWGPLIGISLPHLNPRP